MIDLAQVSVLSLLCLAGVKDVAGLPRFLSGKNSAARSLYMIHCPLPDHRPERQYRIIYSLEIQKFSTKLHPGTEIAFSCHNGYRLSGNSMVRCGEDGKWNQAKMPTCEEISRQAACATPPNIIHGGFKYDNTNPLLVNYYCINGYKFVDPSATSMKCSNGQWEGTQPSCYKSAICPDLGAVKNGRWSCSSSDCLNRQAGAIISVVCNNGYERRGTYSMTCEDNGQWSDHKPTCVSKTCTDLGRIPHGRLECVSGGSGCLDYKLGSVFKVTCDEGYGLKDTSSFMYTLTCRKNGLWSAKKPECVEMAGCKSPVNIHNGQWTLYGQPWMVKYDLFGVGTTVFYQCDPGYKLVGGTEQVMCLPTGMWSGFPPTCQPEFSCKDPGPVKNGRFELTTASCLTYMGMGSKCLQYDVGSKLVYRCDKGYQRDGSYEVECNDHGMWTESPKCTKAPLSLPQGNGLESTTNTMTIVIITSCSVLGILLITMIIVAFQRRNRPQDRVVHQVQAPPPYTGSSRNSVTTVEEHDRVALIAYADGSQTTLPSYDEAVRGLRTPTSRTHRHQYQQATGYRPLPSLPTSMRRQQSDATSSVSSHSARDPDGISRHSILTTSTMNRDALSENFGSIDTMNTANISDGTSTSVTVDTYDSGASMPSIAASRHATAGSIESNGSLGLANEDSPLLHLSNNSSQESILITDVQEEVKDE